MRPLHENSILYGVLTGIGILAAHLAAAALVKVSSYSDLTLWFLMPALTQWVPVLVFIGVWLVQGHRESCKGLVIAAGLITLGNFLCVAALPYTWPAPEPPIR